MNVSDGCIIETESEMSDVRQELNFHDPAPLYVTNSWSNIFTENNCKTVALSKSTLKKYQDLNFHHEHDKNIDSKPSSNDNTHWS